MSQNEMMWSMREDFFAFTEMKGGAWAKIGKAAKKKADEIEKREKERLEAEEAARNETESEKPPVTEDKTEDPDSSTN